MRGVFADTPAQPRGLAAQGRRLWFVVRSAGEGRIMTFTTRPELRGAFGSSLGRAYCGDRLSLRRQTLYRA